MQLFIREFIFLFNLEIICNFDVSLCGFVQGKDDIFNWTRHKGSTPSDETGPSFDHTTGNMTGKL